MSSAWPGRAVARPGPSVAPEAARGVDGARVRGLLERLEATDLRPSPLVDALFNELVEVAWRLPADSPALRSAGLVARAREVCARGESLLEDHWARLVRDRPAELTRFPYLDHYAELVAWEHGVLTAALGRPPRSVVLAGSGPLPLTALLLRRLAGERDLGPDGDLDVTCLDHDAAALDAGRRVAAVLATAPRRAGNARSALRFVHEDATEHDYRGADVVLLAALAGDTPTAKGAVLAQVAATVDEGAVVAARSVPADGRQLLYGPVTARSVPAGLVVLGEREPPAGVVNSLVLLRPG